MNYKRVLAISALCLFAYLIGKYTGKAVTEVKEVEKVVFIEKEVKERDQNVTETEKETRLPDGTIIKEKVKSKVTTTKTEKQKEVEQIKVTQVKTEQRPSYRIGLGYQTSIKDVREVFYSVNLEKRLFSELYLGAQYSTNNTVGVTISIGF